MIVRIQLQRGRPVQQKYRKNRHLALAVGALLVPAALMAYVLGFWRLASDMGLAGEFTINGIFSHWQVWVALAALLQLTATVLTRYGRGSDALLPKIFSFRLGAIPDESPDPASPERRVG